LDEEGLIEIVPAQNREAIKLLGLKVEEAKSSAWLVSTDEGFRYRGAAAVLGSLSLAWKRPRLLQIYGLPFVRQAADLVYWIVTRIRRWIPLGTPYCSRYPGACQRANNSTR
jgi:hypothetical protein